MRTRRLMLLVFLAAIGYAASSWGTSRSPSVRTHTAPFGLRDSPTYAQLGSQLPNKTAPRPLTVRIDGSKTPGLISDERAYTHFLLSTLGNGEKENSRRDSLLRRVGLSDSDRLAYTGAIAELGLKLPGVAAQRTEAIRRESALEYENARQREQELVIAARSRVDAVLTPEGWVALDRYIQQHVKTKVVVYGGPMHSGH